MKTNDELEPTVFVIFGGAGDLNWRKLVPALDGQNKAYQVGIGLLRKTRTRHEQ
jgi:glucose-6-phosphate 1-dehydrogenase